MSKFRLQVSGEFGLRYFRANISEQTFLRGSVLGMREKEIKRERLTLARARVVIKFPGRGKQRRGVSRAKIADPRPGLVKSHGDFSIARARASRSRRLGLA